MEAVYDILSSQGIETQTDWEELGLNTRYTVSSKGTAANMDLEIEKIYDDILMAGHFYTQRMDQMSDPQVRFDIEEYTDPVLGWNPIEFRQDGIPQMYERDETGLSHGVQDFVKTWSQNLRRQGFVEAAERGEVEVHRG